MDNWDTSSQILPQLSRGGFDIVDFVDNRVDPGDTGSTFFFYR